MKETKFKFKRVKLKKSDYKTFQSFLKFSKTTLRTGVIPKAKLNRIAFLEYFILGNRGLLSNKGFQLFTTIIAYKLGVDSQTAMNYIKDLLKAGLLVCTNSTFKIGSHAKTYKIRSGSPIVAILNAYNGYGKESKSEKIILKAQHREARWKEFDAYTADLKDVTAIAQTYLGCRKSFLKDVFNRVPMSVLTAPRENDRSMPRIYDYYYAFKTVTKNANESRPFKLLKMFGEYKCPKGLKSFLGQECKRFDHLAFIGDDPFEEASIYKSLRKIGRVLHDRLFGDLTPIEEKKIKHARKVNKWIIESISIPVDGYFEAYA